ncbi:flavodoxin reductase [Candidatus Dojkabacteria bacterium]|nr:flavodoxin reductase [Candidatus Dojkabacteria bacterium]
MSYTVKIVKIEPITHNVRRYTLEKPENYSFIPGQATDVSINMEEWKEDKHPFTFTCLNSSPTLEFTIKSYFLKDFPNHSGMTEKLFTLNVGDELILDDPWGTINYKGKGIFIAGGAGITPFIAILRDLQSRNEISGNRLFFSNKTEKDIIIKDELIDIFKDNPKDLLFTLTQEEKEGYEHGRINREFLEREISDFKTNFYICGPSQMKHELIETVKGLGASVDSIVFEQ